MGILVVGEHLSHEWPGKRVLVDQSFGIDAGDRIGIVGRNGDGKSTVLDIIYGNVTPDAGTITCRRGTAIGLLGQDDSFSDEQSVRHAILGDVADYVWAADPTTRNIIEHLLGDVAWDARIGEISGGQRRRCDLARVLIGNWDILLMDEPTNHLDLSTITWLATHLKQRWAPGDGALLVVTHDRWFLDEVCERMWEIHDSRIEPFEGGYSAYIQQRVERERQAALAEERRQNALRKELNWLAHGAKARTSKPRFRVEAARNLIANDPPLRNPIELKRLAMSRLGKQVWELDDLSVSYDGTHNVLESIDWLIGPGDRYGILGENGAGKSTLLAAMIGKVHPTHGRVKMGRSVRLGILSQHMDVLADKDDWRLSEVLSSHKQYFLVDGKQTSSEQLAERLGFSRRDFPTYVKSLSGGQRRRLALLCVLMAEPNVLVLDEPGNDLDTDMLTVVEDLLDSWPGTLILVSHDRYLMERVTDDQFALLDGRLRHVPGGVDEYLKLITDYEVSRRSTTTNPTSDTIARQTKGSATAGGAALTNAERHETKRRFEAVSRKLERLEGEPQRLRDELAQIDVFNYEALLAKQAEIDAMDKQIEELETEWLHLAELLGE